MDEPGLADLGPLAGFAAAAEVALDLLRHVVGLDLWLVTQRRGDRQVAVAVRGDWQQPVPTGAVFPWIESFCRHMVAGTAPRIAPRVADVPLYAQVAAARKVAVGAYVGMPLLDWEGQLYGTVCGVSANPRGESLYRHRRILEASAALLSTVLAKEQLAADRSQAAAVAYAMCDRDPTTGLLNGRGWAEALNIEQHRQVREGGTSTLIAVTLRTPPEAGIAEIRSRLQPAADVVSGSCRPYDRVARLEDGLAVLAVDCDALGGQRVAARIDSALRAADLAADVRYLRCPYGTDLPQAWSLCRTDGGVPAEEPAMPEGNLADRDVAIDGADEMIRARAQSLRVLHSSGVTRPELVGLTVGDLEVAGDGVLVVLDRAVLDRATSQGGVWLTKPDQVRVLTHYRDLLTARLAGQARHPSAPRLAAWPLFPVFAPSGYVTPVRLSDRGLARVLYRETFLGGTRRDPADDARRAAKGRPGR